MKQVVYVNQKSWSEITPSQFKNELEEFAKSLSLNIDQYRNDVSDTRSLDEQIDKDVVAGNEIRLEGTPTIVINGVKLDRVPQTKEEYVALFEEARSSATPPVSSTDTSPTL